MPVVTVYSKNECPLCEEAEAVLHEVQAELGFELRRIDIYSDPELYERYKHDIPVIAVDGVAVWRHRVSAEQVRMEWKRRLGY